MPDLRTALLRATIAALSNGKPLPVVQLPAKPSQDGTGHVGPDWDALYPPDPAIVRACESGRRANERLRRDIERRYPR